MRPTAPAPLQSTVWAPDEPPRPSLSVIIVSWNVRGPLRDCLASLTRGAPPAATEIIVVDNASADRTVEMVRTEFPRVTCLPQTENLGFGRASTLGLAAARHDFVLLLNPDTLVPPGAVARLLAHMAARPDIGVLGCRLLDRSGALQRWTAGNQPGLIDVAGHYLFLNEMLGWTGLDRSVYLTRDVTEDRDVGWVSGACMMLRRAWLPEPLFDPAFFLYGEDMELCARVAAAGGRVVYTPRVSITHLQGASMRQQTGPVTLSALTGMRDVYRRRTGSGRAWVFDLLTIAGFGLRTTLFAVAATVRRDAALRGRARSSAHLLRTAVRIARAPVRL